MDTKPIVKEPSAEKKKLQAQLTQSTKDGTFKKSARLRISIKDMK